MHHHRLGRRHQQNGGTYVIRLGDAIMTGYGTLATIKIACMFPANAYEFARSGTPDSYIAQFESWVENDELLRYIISGTGINMPVKVENISYG